MKHLLPMLFVLPVAALLAGPVAAQAPAAGGRPANGVVIVPLQELPDADSLPERAERLWSDFLSLFRLGPNHSQYARRSSEMDHARARTRDDFSTLMDIAGYKLKEIESEIGIVPGLQMTFAQARELTEADREFVERHLVRHARRNPGPLSAIQRLIVHSVLDASDIRGFSVEKVAVDLIPLPKVKLVIAPVDAPLSLDAARIMRGIDGLNRKLERMPALRAESEPPPTRIAPN
ncbi:hypothetical protein STVA_27650 [Allostella vacuolata]|nr:hypothetical protein STVA_27650 [Stella vacuolata]